jgi:serine/threonine protein kinase
MPTGEPREITESFRIERVLKSSRSGIVFRALDPASNIPFAIKLIPPPPAAHAAICRTTFERLAERLATLRPAGVPPVRDYGFTPDGSAFLVMEVVDAVRLDRMESLPVGRVIGVVLSVLDTLTALAREGIEHGNLSPDNVLVGAGDRAWLVGFGTAALRAPGSFGRVVLDGEAAEFAPPERLDPTCGSAVDWHGDLYSVALSVCSLLKAEVAPPDAATPTVRLPSEVATQLRDPNALRATLEQSLRRVPAERPESYDILRDALRAAVGAAAAPATPATPMTTRPAPLAPVGEEIVWEPPEGAPAWLQESSPSFVLKKPEPRQVEPPRESQRDPREDTNPVPLARKAELPLRPQPAAPAPTVGAPVPLPTPALGLAVAPPVPARPGLPAAPAPRALAVTPAGAPVPPPPQPVATPPATTERPPEAHRAAPAAEAPARRLRPLGGEGMAASPPAAPAPPSPTPAPAHPAAPAQETDAAPSQPEAGTPPQDVARVPSLEATPPTGAHSLVAEREAAAEQATPPPALPLAAETPAASEQPGEARPTGASATALPPLRPARDRRWLIVALASVAVVLLGTAGFFVGTQVLRSRRVPPALPSPAPARPRPTAAPQGGAPPQVLAKLAAVEQAVAAGNLDAALAALATISADDELALGPGELGRLTRARTAAKEMRLSVVLGDLRAGLANGNLKLLRDAVRRVTREDEAALAADPDGGQTLEEARRAVNLYSLAVKAQQGGNDTQLLQHASALLEIMPKSNQAAELREKAASDIERDADALAQQGRFDEAISRLELEARHWSTRPGLSARIERARGAKSADTKLAAVLAQAEHSEQERAPERGLELLRAVTPPPYYEERFRQERARLEALLQQLDAKPPVVELPAALKLEYQKNKPFQLTVHITDDHGVKSASVFVRVKGTDRYQELPLSRGAGGEWRAEITPAMHQNKAVELYLVASDQSGHTGRAGSAEQPLQLKKKWTLFGM